MVYYTQKNAIAGDQCGSGSLHMHNFISFCNMKCAWVRQLEKLCWKIVTKTNLVSQSNQTGRDIQLKSYQINGLDILIYELYNSVDKCANVG